VLDFNAADREVELDGRCEEDLFESASLIVPPSLLVTITIKTKTAK